MSPMTATCRHCRKKIVRVTYALGSCWMHDTGGQSRSSDYERYCRLSTAGPDVDTIESNTGIYKEAS